MASDYFNFDVDAHRHVRRLRLARAVLETETATARTGALAHHGQYATDPQGSVRLRFVVIAEAAVRPDLHLLDRTDSARDGVRSDDDERILRQARRRL